MFKRVLVPLDGSPLAESALPLAKKLAAEKLILVRALEVNSMTVDFQLGSAFVAQNYERAKIEAADYLTAQSGSIHTEGIDIQTAFHVGDPASVILDEAKSAQCDLIVMTTHGYRGATRWMLGSVTERVLRNAPCPVLVLRENTSIQHILITLDGSNLAESALAPALELAEQLDAEITLLYVDDSLSLIDYASLDSLDQFEPGMGEAMRVEYAHRGEQYLAATRAVLKTKLPVNVISAVGKAADSILTTADDRGCDLIVMSTHGRSGVRRWVYGSVTEKVLRSAETPLLIVRSEFE